MDKPLKTKTFYGIENLSGAHLYKDFIKENPYIEIVSLVVVVDRYLLLTYK